MADDDTTTDPAGDPGDDGATPGADTGAADVGDAGKRAIDKERRGRRDAERELRDIQAKLKGLEDKDKTEAERLAGRAAEAEKRAEAAEQQLLRLQVGAEKGLTPAQAKRLVGSTREELEADADELLASFGGKKADPPAADKDAPRGRPKEALRAGASPAGAEEKVDYDAMAARIMQRRA